MSPDPPSENDESPESWRECILPIMPEEELKIFDTKAIPAEIHTLCDNTDWEAALRRMPMSLITPKKPYYQLYPLFSSRQFHHLKKIFANKDYRYRSLSLWFKSKRLLKRIPDQPILDIFNSDQQ